MSSDSIQSAQRELKYKYGQDPNAARKVLRSEGVVDQSALVCNVNTDSGVVRAGMHAACGGTGRDACSANMLLESLIGCTGVTLAAVTQAMRIEVAQANIVAEGDLDFRGTLGVDKSAAVGFEAIRVRITMESSASHDELEKIATLTERYCVVYQTLQRGTPISLVIEPIESNR